MWKRGCRSGRHRGTGDGGHAVSAVTSKDSSGWGQIRQGRILVRWVGGLLVIPVWLSGVVLSLAFFRTFFRVVVPEIQDRGRNFLWVSSGVIGWLMVLCLGKVCTGRVIGLRVYVLVHELSHLVWTFLFGGAGRLERVGREGGAVVTDRTNLIIVLAPYFYPLLTVVVVAVAPLLGWVCDYYKVGLVWQGRLDGLLYGLVGFTLAHHYTFTLYVLPRGQSDLIYYGRVFSLMVIWVMNVVVLTVVLLMLPRTAPFAIYWAELGESFGMVSDVLVPWMEGMFDWLSGFFGGLLGRVHGGVSASDSV